jgi:3-deoxy-manno-octulosonate cytidylyltransferase (CMP-KDO synthetase)
MIVHVWRRAMEAEIGRVIVATDSQEIAAATTAAGGEAVMTRADHQSGSDRVFEAVGLVDPDGRHDIIVNVQGDLPTVESRLVRTCLEPVLDGEADIATLGCEITVEEERTNPSVVKVVGSPMRPGRLRALYFTRGRSWSNCGRSSTGCASR